MDLYMIEQRVRNRAEWKPVLYMQRQVWGSEQEAEADARMLKSRTVFDEYRVVIYQPASTTAQLENALTIATEAGVTVTRYPDGTATALNHRAEQAEHLVQHQQGQLNNYQALIEKIQKTVSEFFGEGERWSDFDVLDLGVRLIARAASDLAKLDQQAKEAARLNLEATEIYQDRIQSLCAALREIYTMASEKQDTPSVARADIAGRAKGALDEPSAQSPDSPQSVNYVSDQIAEGPSCHVCGAIMTKAENGWMCKSCGSTTQPTDSQQQPLIGDKYSIRPIDGKFGVRNSEIVNLVSGQAIPQDEPLFLLRARDRHAYDTLMHDFFLCKAECNELHMEGIKQQIRKFIEFANAHPERMKQPGVTRDLKLDPVEGARPFGPWAAADVNPHNPDSIRCRAGTCECEAITPKLAMAAADEVIAELAKYPQEVTSRSAIADAILRAVTTAPKTGIEQQ